MKDSFKSTLVVGTALLAALGAQAPASADTAFQINTDVLVTVASVHTGSPGTSVEGACGGTPAGGGLGTVNYVLKATAQSSSTGLDVPFATGVTCRIWNNKVGGGWLSSPVSASQPGANAVAVGQVSISMNTNPIPCVYANGLFTGNKTAKSRTGSPCPATA